MRLCDPLTDRQAQAESAALGHPRAHTIGTPESLEDVWKIRRGNTDPCVAHSERNVVGMTAESKLYLPTGRRVFDGIGDEVEEELPQASPVRHDRGVGGERKIHRHALCLAQYERRLVDLLYQRLQLHRLAMQIEPSLIGASKSQ